MKSIWSDGIDSNFKTPDSPMKTEVLIIGGGLCGVLCAYFLDQKGVDYILVESGSIGGGITINTTAKITAQHGLIYDDLLRRLGHERAGQYLNANLWAVEKYSELSENIPCDFERKPAYVYSIENGDIIEKELDAVTKLGFGAEFSRELCLPFHTEGAIKFPNQAQFDPIKFINGIARGLHIFENTFVEKLSRNTAKTKYGTITADKIIVATHYPMINLAGLYSAKMYQERSYVIALKDAGYVDGMYLDAAKNGMSFRNYKEFLLVGGGGHRTGRDGGGWQVLRDFSEKKYPGAREVYSWAAQDCISLDKIPYIGLLSGLLHEVYVATGFNKWGMTSSMVSASILADMVTGTTNSFAPVFCPGRSMIKKQLSANLLMAAADLASFGAKRCPHLGCALKWNHLEKTWDCPCHGSRFTRTGELLDNPAKRGIKITHPFSH